MSHKYRDDLSPQSRLLVTMETTHFKACDVLQAINYEIHHRMEGALSNFIRRKQGKAS